LTVGLRGFAANRSPYNHWREEMLSLFGAVAAYNKSPKKFANGIINDPRKHYCLGVPRRGHIHGVYRGPGTWPSWLHPHPESRAKAAVRELRPAWDYASRDTRRPQLCDGRLHERSNMRCRSCGTPVRSRQSAGFHTSCARTSRRAGCRLPDIALHLAVVDVIFVSMPTRMRPLTNASPPTWVKPQLAALVKVAPDGSDWLHEIKMDGYRMHARLDAGRVNILTRRGNDWTAKYPAIAEYIARLPATNAYLDGELCGVLPDGRTAFNLIQNASDTGQGALVFFLLRPPVSRWRRPDGDAA
jgi:hypothetical protein